MKTLNEIELKNTQQKLARLQALYQEAAKEAGGDQELREMELESLMRLINQMKEEISRSESHRVVHR